MSERPNDAPDGLIEEPRAEPPTNIEAAGLEGEAALEPDELDEGLDEVDAEAGSSGSAPASSPDEAAATAAEADVHREHGLRPSERRAARAAERTQIPIDPALRIKDRASTLFVLLTIVVFGLIALNGLALGKGGFLTPLPTLGPLPTPVVTAAPTVAPTTAPTTAPTVEPTTAPTVEPTVAPSPAPIAS